MISLSNWQQKAKLNCDCREILMLKKIVLAILPIFFSAFLPACVYKFSNKNLKTPEGIRTVAIEAVFDTSREVLHHENLWSELQKAFATDGHLRVVTVGKADALVRAHIKSASLTPSGESQTNGPERDPKVFNGEIPEDPTKFQLLSQAGKYRDKAVISTVVEVEVWNLWTRTLILKRSYSLSDSLQTIHGTAITTKGNDFLRLEESSDARFHEMSKNIANQVVRDLFIN